MRLVLVNEVHPDSPHVGAIRFREFAKALRARGHEVELLTDDLVPTAEMDVAALPWGLRHLAIAWRYLVLGGPKPRWRRRMQQQVELLAAEFRPDLVWANFGNLDCWNVARDLARRAGCPWVADLKDFWPHFIPAPLRGLLAQRYRDAAAWTALSRTHAEVAKPWFDVSPIVIYSGFPAAAIRQGTERPAPTVFLFGSLYKNALLTELLRGLTPSLRLVYRGNDHAFVESTVDALNLGERVDIGGFVPTDELLAMQRSAAANVYLRTDRTFHHKFLELLAARRPILALPGDNDEARAIAAGAGVPLLACRTADEVTRALMAAALGSAVGDPTAIRGYSWEAQAEKLEAVFEKALEHRA